MKTAGLRATPPPVLRTVYVTDANERGDAVAATPALPMPSAGTLAQVPMNLLAAIGERLAAGIAEVQQGEPTPGVQARAEFDRLERLGLQLQELAHIVSRAQQLRRENVDLGLALLQTVAEWSSEADRLGVDLHGPVASVMAHANPAALKHLFDLVVEHALQQGRSVRLDIERGPQAQPPGRAEVTMLARVSSEPASSAPARDTLAWLLLGWLARSLGLPVERQAVERGEVIALRLPAAS